jgi:hypothetical protein
MVGQDDHLRLFSAQGYLATLEEAGFSVERYDAFDKDTAQATAWRLDPFEQLHICRN